MSTEQKNIKVVVRVRPYNRRELEQNQRTIIKVMDQTTLLFDPDEDEDEFFFQGVKQNHRDITKKVNKKLSMEYDRVYDTDTTNMQIFEECTAPLVDSVLNGYNCSVFVYGATGAGKTFTMLGSTTSPGLTFLTMRDLFDKIEAQSDVRKFDVGVSYLEVYNEQVMNLLTKTGPLKLREDSNGVVVSGLVLKPIYSAEELLELLALGNSNRTQHPTDANAESSRSHAVFQVHIRITDRKTGTKRMVKLSMIDLAGSERAASTKGIGIRFKEGASINKSLLALGNCINKLADGLKHIPYRDSNLTRILKDSLGGNCQTLMVANVSMSSLTYEDTYNTLKYASRAKKIRTTLRQNALKTNMPKEFYVKKVNELMDENERLKQTNSALEAKANKATTFDESELKPWYSRIDQIYASIVKTQEIYISIKSRVKNLTFRIKLKTDMENSRKILYGDCESQENYSSYTSSVCHLSKQIDKLTAEIECWRQKLRNLYKNLDKIKAEIKSSKYGNFLQIYLKYKNSEIQNSKKSLINKHITAIDLELSAKATWLQTSFNLASQVIKNGNLNTQQRYHYELLERHLSNTNISNEVDDEVKGENNISYSTQPASSDEDVDHPTGTRSCNKRLRLDEYDLDDTDDINGSSADDGVEDDDDMVDMHTTFKMPAKRPRNPNETHVLSEMDTNGNATFYMGPSTSSTARTKINTKNGKELTMAKSNIVSNMISDKMVKATSNAEQLKNVLLKSKKFSHATLRTVAGGLQKENKKFSPNRVRKSPRTLLSKAASTQRQTSRLANDDAAPVVRLNRAASFRTKK
ncbi:kinesin-like protein KIF18A [Lucilia sericata]|uniref:kinesin-like protein KIF18A n=1 Tax=Lucilia sericata TaxID=13632 RepID=UPI0018A7F347|nr:kinesin-like protein KIF18A [Lucilia sericata]